jgi:hypothetical protein
MSCLPSSLKLKVDGKTAKHVKPSSHASYQEVLTLSHLIENG